MPGSFPVLSTGSSFCYPVQRTVNRRSVVHRFCDFSEQTYALGYDDAPTEFVFVWNSISTVDKDSIRAFYAAQNGEEATDWSMFFDDTLYLNCKFVGPCKAEYINPNLWRISLQVRTTAGNGATIVFFPHGEIVSARFFLITAYTAGGAGALFGGGASFDSVGTLFPVPSWFHSSTSWAKRVDSISVDPAKVMTRTLFLLLMVEHDGGTPPVPSPPSDQLQVFDAYINVLYADGTSGVYRPGGTATSVINATGSVTGASNVLDGNGDTFALLSVSQYGGVGIAGAFLNLNAFAAVE